MSQVWPLQNGSTVDRDYIGVGKGWSRWPWAPNCTTKYKKANKKLTNNCLRVSTTSCL